MDRGKKNIESVDEYIRSYPGPVRKMLAEVRSLVRAQAPQAEERLSYQMPAVFLNRNIVYFAAHTNHIGFYPGAGVLKAFKSKVSKYKNAKGSIQFPFGEPLPKELITQMVRFKVRKISKER